RGKGRRGGSDDPLRPSLSRRVRARAAGRGRRRSGWRCRPGSVPARLASRRPLRPGSWRPTCLVAAAPPHPPPRPARRARGARGGAEMRSAADDTAVTTPVEGPDDAAARLEEATRVRAALAALPEAERRTIEIAYFEGLSHTEIAAREGTPLGTVKTRIRDGVLRLRELFSGEAPHA